MQFLYILESIRVPVLDSLMLLVTRLGEETAFLAAALIVFWCLDKRQGYYLMTVGFVGTMASQFLKLFFRIPRPWVLDPEFTIVESARKAATGYSFPSGHSQTAVGTFGVIAQTSKSVVVKWLCVAVCVLVPLSRMYLGVHTPADVLVGSALALLLVFGLKKPILKGGTDRMPWLIGLMLAMAVALLLYVTVYPFPDGMDVDNLESGTKNAYTMLGCLAGIAVVYPLERTRVNFPTRAVWYAQLLKILGGLVLVLAVKEGLRAPLNVLFAGHMAERAVRYFLIVVTAGLLWPMTFPWFSKIGVKE